MPISRVLSLADRRYRLSALRETVMEEIIGKSNVIVMMLVGMSLEKQSSSLSTETQAFISFQISNQNIQSTIAEDAR